MEFYNDLMDINGDSVGFVGECKNTVSMQLKSSGCSSRKISNSFSSCFTNSYKSIASMSLQNTFYTRDNDCKKILFTNLRITQNWNQLFGEVGL